MIYSKTLEVKDYNSLPEVLSLYKTMSNLDGLAGYRFEHLHRAWEYGIILNALIKNGAKNILDVGGGGSLFAAAAVDLGISVLQIDPEDYSNWAKAQAKVLEKPLPYLLMDFFDYNEDTQFDAVVSISVLEHVENDLEFFLKMLNHVKPGGLLAMTVDFHPTGEALVYPAHLRTYNRDSLGDLYLKAEDFNFFGSDCIHKTNNIDYFAGKYDYRYRTNNVNDYTFASLILRRNND